MEFPFDVVFDTHKHNQCLRDMQATRACGHDRKHETMRKPVLAEAASLVAQMVKNLCTMQEMRVRSLGQEDPLEEEIGNPLQCSCLENPMDGGAWWATVHGVQRVRHD